VETSNHQPLIGCIDRGTTKNIEQYNQVGIEYYIYNQNLELPVITKAVYKISDTEFSDPLFIESKEMEAEDTWYYKMNYKGDYVFVISTSAVVDGITYTDSVYINVNVSELKLNVSPK
jgi:hypothetical protein